MKIAITSDTHNLDFEFPEADLFIHCGDMTNGGSIKETATFAQRLNASDYEAGIIVPGNHDRLFQTMEGTARGLFHPRFHVLIDETISWQGMAFHGSPWTLPCGEYAFMKNERELARLYSQSMPPRLDFLITHGPPKGLLDRGGAKGGNDHLGSKSLRDAVMGREILKYHVFGHIHNQGGQEVARQGTEFHNVCATDIVRWTEYGREFGKYVMKRPPLVMEFD